MDGSPARSPGPSCSQAAEREAGESIAEYAARVIDQRIIARSGQSHGTQIDRSCAVGRDGRDGQHGNALRPLPWTPKFKAVASLATLPNVSEEPRTAVLAEVALPGRAIDIVIGLPVGLATTCRTPALTVVGPVLVLLPQGQHAAARLQRPRPPELVPVAEQAGERCICVVGFR